MRSTARKSWFAGNFYPRPSHSAYGKELFAYSINHTVDFDKLNQLSSNDVSQDPSLHYVDNGPRLRKHQSTESSFNEVFTSFHTTVRTLQQLECSNLAIKAELTKEVRVDLEVIVGGDRRRRSEHA